MKFYRFQDREEFLALAGVAGFISSEGQLITDSHNHSICEVGIITKGGSIDPVTGDVVDPPIPIEGWHVNYQGDPPAAWSEFLIDPKNPVRVFFV